MIKNPIVCALIAIIVVWFAGAVPLSVAVGQSPGGDASPVTTSSQATPTFVEFSGIAVSGVGVAEPVEPLAGPIMLAGDGDLSNVSLRTFAWLADEDRGRLLIVTKDERTLPLDRWQRAIGTVDRLTLATRSQADALSAIELLSEATGVWFVDDVTDVAVGSGFHDALESFAAQGGAIGGQGAGASSLGQWVVDGDGDRRGFTVVPQGIIQRAETDAKSMAIERSRALPDECVRWIIPESGVMVIHQGRRVAVIGESDITAHIPAANGWPERTETFGAPIVQLPYTTDLMAWTRSAQSRGGPVFPPSTAPAVEVPTGTLMLIGGGGSTDDMWARFIEAAGGTDANFVCLPQSADSFSARELRKRGCKRVTVLFSENGLRDKAQSDNEFLRPLADADAVFFGGGRTFVFMDAYQNTTAHRLMLDVLDRGGVIAGTSAGAQIQGDFLVRGDPRTNQTLWYPGNDTGLAFLRGVIVDVHFGERGRQRTLPSLLSRHPQMAGVGIDEATAIVVTGHTAEVLGRGEAWFYDSGSTRSNAKSPTRLKAGQTYDFRQAAKSAPPPAR